MTTKNNRMFLKNQQKSGAPDIYRNSDNHASYSNLNLNQKYKFLNLIPSQSRDKPSKDKFYETESKKILRCTAATFKLSDSAVSDNYEGKVKSQAWNKSNVLCSNTLKLDGEVQEKAEKPWTKDDNFSNTSNSTLSLHIAAFENSVEAAAFNGIKKFKNKKEILTASTFFIQNPFEFPRQQNDKVTEPNMSHYRASQQLFNPNEGSRNNRQVANLKKGITMAGLVGYQYDSDEETRRFSMSKDDDSPARIIPSSSTLQKPPSQAAEVVVVDEEMPDASPEVQIIEGKGSRSPPAPIRQRSPYVGGYAEQWRRKATPVNVAPEVQQKYNYMFQLKSQGRNLEQELDGNKAFKNPALYEFLMGRFDIDPTGSALPKSARVFNREDFDKDDFYDQLALRQEGSDGGHHKSKSKHH